VAELGARCAPLACTEGYRQRLATCCSAKQRCWIGAATSTGPGCASWPRPSLVMGLGDRRIAGPPRRRVSCPPPWPL